MCIRDRWFTLGSGIGCLILAVGYVVPLRHSGSATLLEVIGEKYGLKAEYFGSVLCSIGIFISVIAQVLSSSARDVYKRQDSDGRQCS